MVRYREPSLARVGPLETEACINKLPSRPCSAWPVREGDPVVWCARKGSGDDPPVHQEDGQDTRATNLTLSHHSIVPIGLKRQRHRCLRYRISCRAISPKATMREKDNDFGRQINPEN